MSVQQSQLTKKQIAADVAFIKKYLKTNKIVPEDGQETEIPANENAAERTYVYTDSVWVFKSFKGDDSDSESDSDEDNNSEKESKLSDDEKSEEEPVEKPKRKKAPTKAAATAASDTANDTETTTTAPKKSRQPKKVKELLVIMAALDKNKIDKAKELLAAAIESAQGSAKEKKERKPSEYNMFMSSELIKLKDSHPDTPPKERMKIAMENWKTAKAAKMAAI